MNAAIAALRHSPGQHATVKQALGEAALRANSSTLSNLDWLWDHLSPEGRAKLLTERAQTVPAEELADG